ncbi:hypothetical protein WA016_04340 [Myxococcus stipitatus]
MVSLVELAFPYPHGTTFQPIFRRHPYGIVVAIAPGWNACQFAYRVEKDDGSLAPRTRQLVGHARGGELRDTLLIWLRRLSLLRLKGGEDVAELVRRVESALEPGPVEMSRQWSPVPLDPARATPPGVPWDRLLDHECRAFLQADRGSPDKPRFWWGLERVLRMALPFTLAHKGARLCYRGYDLEPSSSSEAASRSGKSWFRRLTLRLELVCSDGTVLPVLLPAGVPEVDDHGRMLLDGIWYRWVPRVLDNGLLAAGDGRAHPESSFDEELDEEVEEELPTPEYGTGPGASDVEGPEPELEAPQELLQKDKVASSSFPSPRDVMAIGALAGGSLCALLESAVYRKLRGLGLLLGRYQEDALQLPRSLPALLRGLVGRDDRLLLVSKVFLKAVLEPAPATTSPEGHLRILRHAIATEAGTAPAWACPDVSASLRPGSWVPVEVARLTPGGDLAVPLQDAAGQVRLGVSMESLPQVNPRAGGTSGMKARGWIAPALSHFDSLPAGRLQSAAHVAIHASPLPEELRVVCIHGPQLRARWVVDAPLPSARKTIRFREVNVRLPGLLAREGFATHRVLVSRGAAVNPGQAWLEAERTLWSRIARGPLKVKSLHPMNMWNFAASVVTFVPKKPKDEDGDGEEQAPLLDALRLPSASEQWFVPPGVHGWVVDIRQELERDKAGAELAWRITLVVGTQPPPFPWSHLVLTDGRVIPFQEALKPEDAPYGEDGLPAQLVIEDPSLATTPLSEVWFAGQTGEVLERATTQVGRCFTLPETSDLMAGPDLQLRFRARDGEGIPASVEAPALSSLERLWWTAVCPEDAAKLSDIERAWGGDVPPFLPRLAEVLEAAGLEPPAWMNAKTARQPGRGRAVRLETLTISRMGQWVTGHAKEEDAPLQWSCWCGRTHGRRRAFEPCEPDSWGCGTSVLLRQAAQERRALPTLGLSEPVLHPWRMESAACLLGLTVLELKTRQVQVGAVVLGVLMHQALRQGPPGAAGRKRLGGGLSAMEREALLRGLESLERDAGQWGKNLVGRFFLSALSVLPNTFHPTGLPPGAPALVKSPLTTAYQQVRFASNRLTALRPSGSKLLVETARASFLEAIDALFGPLNQGRHHDEPRNLAGLITRLWPLTRAPGLRSVVPGLFRVEGRPSQEGLDSAFIEQEVERLPSVLERLSRASTKEVQPPPRATGDDDNDSDEPIPSPRDGIDVVRVRTARTAPGATTLGIFSSEQAIFFPPLPSPTPEPSSSEFWEERAARERLIRIHLPFLMGIVGAFSQLDAEQVETREELSEALRMPSGSVGTVTLREFMKALSRRESRPLGLCRLFEARGPTPLAEDGAKACAMVEETARKAFPGDAPWLQLGRHLLARALSGWWKSFPREGAPSGWAWEPPEQKGPARSRRFVPPLTSTAWSAWPGMTAVTTPVRFLMASAGQPTEGGLLNPVLQRALGMKAGDVPLAPVLPVKQLPLESLGPMPSPPSPAAPHLEVLLVPLEPVAPPLSAAPSSEDEVSLLDITVAAWLGNTPRSPPEVSLLSTTMDAWLKQGKAS